MAVVNRVVVLASDLSGETGAESVTFDIANVLREMAKSFPKINLDLLAAELDEITEAIDEATTAFEENLKAITGELYAVHAALRAAGSQTTGGAASKSSTRTDAELVREWARENGHNVADRGRLSADVQAAYDRAHATKVTNLDPAAPVQSWDNSVAGDGDVIENGPTDDEIMALESETV